MSSRSRLTDVWESYLVGPGRFVLFILSLALTSKLDDAASRRSRRHRHRRRAQGSDVGDRTKGASAAHGSVYDDILTNAGGQAYSEESASEADAPPFRTLHSFQRKLGKSEIVRAWQLEAFVAEWLFRAVQICFGVFVVVAVVRYVEHRSTRIAL